MFLAVSVGNGAGGRITLQKIFIGSRARGGRVTPVGRPRLGRGAVEPRARGDENQGERNNFLRFQEQLLRRKKQELFLGVSVGNGAGGRISLQTKNPRIFCPRISRIFVQASAEPNLFGLCRVQPKMSKKFTRIQCASKMATCSVARIFTNSMRRMGACPVA